MRIDLLMLEDIQAQVPVMTAETFSAQYPFTFLVAMGFLSAEEQRKSDDWSMEETSRFVLGGKLSHDAHKDHPLSGCAFGLKQDQEGQHHVSIGRSQECEITVPETSVSEKHCLVSMKGDTVLITDIGSTNGTTVNLDPVEPNAPRRVFPEDIITVGRYSFQLHSPETLFESLLLLEHLKS